MGLLVTAVLGVVQGFLCFCVFLLPYFDRVFYSARFNLG